VSEHEPGRCATETSPSTIRVVRWRHATAVLRSADTYSSTGLAQLLRPPIDQTFLAQDPPAHSKGRRPLEPAFRRDSIRDSAELIREGIGVAVDGLEEGQIDLASSFARVFPPRVIAALLGLSPSNAVDLARWLREVDFAAVDPGLARAAARKLDELLLALVMSRDGRSGSRILQGLPTEASDAVAILRLLLDAAVETTSRATIELLALIARDSELQNACRDDPLTLGRTIDESLRWAPPVTSLLRRAVKDVRLGGTHIPAGALVEVDIVAANRDPMRFGSAADRVDICRHGQATLTFGTGVHTCIGRHLARAELVCATSQLLSRYRLVALEPRVNNPHGLPQGMRLRPKLAVLLRAYRP